MSLSGLEQTFKDLNSHKIKDSLSSFLPHIPGEFDRPPDTPDTMLRHLLDQRTIGGKEFSPLSGQALLGFRLLPGPVSLLLAVLLDMLQTEVALLEGLKMNVVGPGQVASIQKVALL